MDCLSSAVPEDLEDPEGPRMSDSQTLEGIMEAL